MRQPRFKHKVVDSIPERMESNVMYITADGDVAGHLCACGCGREVITPLSPTDWSVEVNRRGFSLSPSVGNWAFPCRSHYFLRSSAVVWAGDMSDFAIEQGRRRSKARKQAYYEVHEEVLPASLASRPPNTSKLDESRPSTVKTSAWRALLVWLTRLFAR